MAEQHVGGGLGERTVMDNTRAVEALFALAQDSRLAVFRLLVRAGEQGLAAGEIAAALDLPPNTLSAHLKVLTRAGLLDAVREGRRIIYRVDFDGARRLLAYLLEDCCQADPRACAPALASALSARCST